MLIALPAQLAAQQRLWEGAQVISPEIYEDNTVTFR